VAVRSRDGLLLGRQLRHRRAGEKGYALSPPPCLLFRGSLLVLLLLSSTTTIIDKERRMRTGQGQR